MNNAAEEDIRANSEKQPALAKLRMLNEAMETLRKYASPLILIQAVTLIQTLITCLEHH
jgi:hypothetical protein